MEPGAPGRLMISRCRGVEDKLAEKNERLGPPQIIAAVFT